MLEIRKFRNEDKEGCIDLLKHGHDAKFSTERFEWLHERNLRAPSDIAVALDGAQILGFYAALKKSALIAGRPYVAARDIDPVVAPECRGKGIFSKLLEFGLDNFQGIDFFYNFANPTSAPGFLKRGWKQVGPLRDFVCQTGYLHPLSRAFLLFLGTAARVRRKWGEEIREMTFEELADSGIPDPMPPENCVWVERSLPYLRWRFKENPLQRYQFFVHYQGSSAVQCAVVRWVEDRHHLFVLDVMNFQKGTAHLGAFLADWKQRFYSASIYLWHTAPLAVRRYFVTNPAKRTVGQNFLVRKFPGRKVPDLIYDANQWFLMRGDSEVF